MKEKKNSRNFPAIFSIENFRLMLKNGAVPAGVVLGLGAGVLADKLLKQVFTSKPVTGIMGVEMSEKTAKYFIPIMEIGGGLLSYVLCTRQQVNDIIKYAAAGFAGYGAMQLFRNVVNPAFLKGFQFEGLENIPQLPASAAPILMLPELNGYYGEVEAPILMLPELNGFGSVELPAGFEGSDNDQDDVSGFEGSDNDQDDVSGFEGSQEYSFAGDVGEVTEFE